MISISSLLTLALVTAQLHEGGQHTEEFQLPRDAFVVDLQQVPSKIRVNRALLFWMLAPSWIQPRPRERFGCNLQFCNGGCFTGPTRVSVVDMKERRVINTVEVRTYDGYDSFFVPYEAAFGYDSEEARPASLRDCNGDGRALEVPFSDWLNCADLMTTFVGYSERRDAVTQYLVKLEIKERRKRTTVTQYWTEGLNCGPDRKSGRWKYTWDTRGRNGCLDRYNIWYHQGSEMFTGSLARQCEEEDGGPPP
jgi:hypothetical protein